MFNYMKYSVNNKLPFCTTLTKTGESESFLKQQECTGAPATNNKVISKLLSSISIDGVFVHRGHH